MTNVDTVFHVCGGCANKIGDANLPEGAFRCPLVAHIIGTDLVWYHNDTTDCVRGKFYRSLAMIILMLNF